MEKDIWLTFGIAASLLLPISLGFNERPEGVEWVSFLPTASLVLISLYRANRRSFSARTNAETKTGLRFGVILAIILIPSALALKKWAFAAGLPVMAVASILSVSLGFLMCMLPFWKRNLIAGLGTGLACIAIGLGAPFCPREYFISFALAVLTLGALFGALIMRWQLDRANQSNHGA